MHDRSEFRTVILNAWQAARSDKPLSALEKQIVTVLHAHPEYHALLTPDARDHDYLPEAGNVNPFLHISLHLGLQEQLATQRPAGINDIYTQLATHYDTHEAEHRMMDVLAETLWEAQRAHTTPNEKTYLQKLRRLFKK